MEEKLMFGLLNVYRERGYYLRRLEQFGKAKNAYDQAFEKFPEDIRLLIGRSQAASDAVKPREALENAEAALKLDRMNMNARNVQARALFTMTEFERSLIMNFRGSRYRRQPPYFLEGINQGLETLEDSVGKNAGPVMIDFLPLIQRHLTVMQDDDEPAVKKHVSRIPQLEEKKKQTQMQMRKHVLLSRVLAMKYLGPMAYDKFFLQELQNDRRLESANTKASAELKKITKEALQSLCERQEILRAQRPYYSIKHAEETESKRQTKFKKDLLLKGQQVNTRIADRMIRSIERAVHVDRNIRSLISQAERMQIFLDSKTKRSLPDKNTYTDRLYKAVGEGYLCMHRLSYHLGEVGNRRRIAFLMGLPQERPRSYDSVRAKYPYKFVDMKDEIEKVSKTLDMCENPYMRCWLMYEMAKLLNKQKNFALAKFYAKKCQREAEEIGSTSWLLNATFTLISGEMKQGNTNEVRIAIEEAQNYSKRLINPVEVQAFLEMCLEMSSEPITADEAKMVSAREKQILKVMDEKSAVDTGVLFKRMSTVPVGRRFKVLPMPPKPQTMACERKHLRHLGISVVPGKEKGLPPVPKSNIPGLQYFDL